MTKFHGAKGRRLSSTISLHVCSLGFGRTETRVCDRRVDTVSRMQFLRQGIIF